MTGFGLEGKRPVDGSSNLPRATIHGLDASHLSPLSIVSADPVFPGVRLSLKTLAAGYVWCNSMGGEDAPVSAKGTTLSELGIEKIIVELNGFRQRTAMLKEEISKVTRVLSERAGQLNDLVGKNLRDLREQLGGSTLSGYLALQGKVSQGEIGEQEYSMQRDYFRNELSGMIRHLDETRKLMMIMAQLDARPNPPQAPTPQQPGRQ